MNRQSVAPAMLIASMTSRPVSLPLKSQQGSQNHILFAPVVTILLAPPMLFAPLMLFDFRRLFAPPMLFDPAALFDPTILLSFAVPFEFVLTCALDSPRKWPCRPGLGKSWFSSHEFENIHELLEDYGLLSAAVHSRKPSF